MIETRNKDQLYGRVCITLSDIEQIAKVGRSLVSLTREVGGDTQIEVLNVDGEYTIGHFAMLDDWWAFFPMSSALGDSSSID